MKVFFATNRGLNVESDGLCIVDEVNEKPWDETNLEAFRIGTAKVEIASAEDGDVQGKHLDDKANYQCARLAEQIYCTKKREYTKRGSEEIFKKLLKSVHKKLRGRNRCSVLVFIHGFDNSFKESIQTGAELAHLYSSEDHHLIPFVFSWPSAGEFGNIQYNDDRQVAESSGCAGARVLACFLQCLSKFQQKDAPCLSSAFLVTHSMGAYVLSHAVRNLQKILCPVFPIFDATILTAPDVDVDAL